MVTTLSVHSCLFVTFVCPIVAFVFVERWA